LSLVHNIKILNAIIMNFSKKNHELVGQNEQNVTKSQKHDLNLQKTSTLYFQVGLILTLLATYGLFEM